MSSDDLFERRSLLPSGTRSSRSGQLSFDAPSTNPVEDRHSSEQRVARFVVPTPPRSATRSPNALEHEPSEERSPAEVDTVFNRPTVIPELPPEEHAKALLRDLEGNRAETSTVPPSGPIPSDSLPALSLNTDSLAASDSALAFVDQQTDELSDSDFDSDFGFEIREVVGESSVPPARSSPDLADSLHDRKTMQLPEEFLATDAGSFVPDLRASSISLTDLYAVGDFSGALAEAEQRLSRNPDDEAARAYAERCTEVLTRMWTARLGSLQRPVRMLVSADQLRWLSVDHRAGFLLSLIDGNSTLDDLLDISGMPRLDALKILAELAEKGVIEVL